MKLLFDQVSKESSRIATRKYSTSFSLGILFLGKSIRTPVYSIYGFVRVADEIVDSFHGYDQASLLRRFRRDTEDAIREKISVNPILNAFQEVVHEYGIRREWIDTFLDSMEMDLNPQEYSRDKYDQYIYGSAEVVGLMCLHVFTNGNQQLFDQLKPYAQKLGSAFQKVNFLRDLKEDNEVLRRTYFPNVDLTNFTASDKARIEREIESEFADALTGIKMLPVQARNGVYLAYYYYLNLFRKIKRLPAQRILRERVRIPNYLKIVLLFKSNIRTQLNMY